MRCPAVRRQFLPPWQWLDGTLGARLTASQQGCSQLPKYRLTNCRIVSGSTPAHGTIACIHNRSSAVDTPAQKLKIKISKIMSEHVEEKINKHDPLSKLHFIFFIEIAKHNTTTQRLIINTLPKRSPSGFTRASPKSPIFKSQLALTWQTF